MPVAEKDTLTLRFPRKAVGEITSISDSLVDRMHALLERNTDGKLSPIERKELETLVKMAQFAQLVSMAVQPQGKS